MTGVEWEAVSIVAIDDVWSALRFRPASEVGSRVKRSPAELSAAFFETGACQAAINR
jgi:hypothetical protein